MAYTRVAFYTLKTLKISVYKLSVLMLIIALGACGGMPKKDKSGPELPPGGVKDGQQEAPLVKIPNPYLVQDTKAPERARTQFEQAKVAMQSEEWALAEQILTQMTVDFPELSGVYVNLGNVYLHQERWEQAEDAYKFALEKNSLNNDAYNQYGILLRNLGRFDEAEQQYLKALEVWPHNPHAHQNLAILYDLYMGKFELALNHYEMAQKVLNEPSQQIEGWIIDLKRRMADS